MLDYEWGSPSSIMLNGAVSVTVDEPTSQQPDPNRHNLFDHHYSQTLSFNHETNNNNNNHHLNNTNYLNPNDYLNQNHHYLNNPAQTQTQTQTHPHPHFGSLYDPRAYGSDCGYALEPEGGSHHGYIVMPKTEPVGCAIDFTNNRIGLNLGGRTYFSSAEDDFVNRLYRRSRPLEAALVSSPRCQAEGCNADLTHAKHYHRRHKVCEFHSKASTVITAGLTQRFCQQCSRYGFIIFKSDLLNFFKKSFTKLIVIKYKHKIKFIKCLLQNVQL